MPAAKRIPTEYERRGGKRSYTDADLRPLRELPDTEVINEDIYGVPYAHETGMADRLLREARETLEQTAPRQAQIDRSRTILTSPLPEEGLAGKIGRYAKGFGEAATTSLHPQRELMEKAAQEPLVYSDEDRWSAMNRALLTGMGEGILGETTPLSLALNLTAARPVKAVGSVTRGVAGSLNALRPAVKTAGQRAAMAEKIAEARGLTGQGFSREMAGKLSGAPVGEVTNIGTTGRTSTTAIDTLNDFLNQGYSIEDAIAGAAGKGKAGKRVRASLEALYRPGTAQPRVDPRLRGPNPIAPASDYEDYFNLMRR